MGQKTTYTTNAFVFVLIGLLLWFNWESFFWRDDWFFIDDYFHKSFLAFVFEPFGGHVMPLFKLVYYSEISLFGKNALLYQLVTTIVLGLLAYIFSLELCAISGKENSPIATFLAVLLCAHPDFGNVTLFSFPICMLSELLFQALVILFYFKFIKSNNLKFFYLFILFLLTQNYFFGNGLFFPLLFIFHQVINKEVRTKKTVIVLILLQLLLVFIQASVSDQSIGLHYLIQNKFEILKSFYELLSISITRFFFIKQSAGIGIVLISFLLFAFLCFMGLRKNRKLFMFGLVYLMLCSIEVPIARFGITDSFPYYYSGLLFPPFCFLLCITLTSFNFQSIKPLAYVCSILLILYFILDIQVKRIYSYRNFKNQENLTTAVKYSKKYYYPFDDPCITDFKNLYIDNSLDTGVQNSLEKNNHFEMDSTVTKYLGEKSVIRFKEISGKVIEDYKLLSQRSKIDIDLKFEKN